MVSGEIISPPDTLLVREGLGLEDTEETTKKHTVANHPRVTLKVAADGGWGTPPYTALRETLRVPYNRATKHNMKRPWDDDDDGSKPLADDTKSPLFLSCTAGRVVDSCCFDATLDGRRIRFRSGLLGGVSEGRRINDRCCRERKNADAVKKDEYTRAVVIIRHMNVLVRWHRLVSKVIIDCY